MYKIEAHFTSYGGYYAIVDDIDNSIIETFDENELHEAEDVLLELNKQTVFLFSFLTSNRSYYTNSYGQRKLNIGEPITREDKISAKNKQEAMEKLKIKYKKFRIFDIKLKAQEG